MNWLIERIKWWLCRKELERLHRYETHLQQYRQWFCEFDDISIVLENLQCAINGDAASASYPTPKNGPWCVSSLRHAVRNIRQNRGRTYVLGGKVYHRSLSNQDLIIALIGEVYRKNNKAPSVILRPVAECIGADYAKAAEEESKVT